MQNPFQHPRWITVLAALAPIIWGSSYLVTTEFLQDVHPVSIALFRALPAGVALLIIVRKIPTGVWLWRMLILGALNFSLFWTCLFFTAQLLPGGVAATLGAVQALFVILAARLIINEPIKAYALVASFVGITGVALIVLSPNAEANTLGVAAGVLGALSMALGTVLTRKWKPPVSNLTFTAWQLTAGGLLLAPLSIWIEGGLPTLSHANLVGIGYLCVVGAALSYVLWFQGIEVIPPAAISVLGFLSPVSAVALGWVVLGQNLTFTQITGVALVLLSIVAAQRPPTPKRKRPRVVARPLKF
ncbi:EamA family transporter [Halocynthiibacter sp. C4]|uniref:DMT family transporter n=1 Tax=Halocynthiibacter sp. C4 TaxID=2992758 RepID=UPI00237A6E7D|nr:EamA family transporter [Halocynthiibacter sp. C4]MDE0588365.1 EamA family transporter [Halocynthiibacter sp. C4]